MKTSRYLWITGNILITFVILYFIPLESKIPSIEPTIRYGFINEHWWQFNLMWRSELLIISIITVASVYFATKFKTLGWAFVVTGHVILVAMYPIMLGGYHDTSVELYTLAYELSKEIFTISNSIIFTGFTLVHWGSDYINKYFRYSMTTMSGLIALFFTAGFVELLTLGQVMMIGPIIIIVYLGNAWMMYKLELNRA